MASKYRKIDPRIWSDEGFISLSESEKLLAMYILTCPQCNRIGLYRFSLALSAEDLDTSAKAIESRLAKVCHTLNWKWDANVKVIYLPTWWKYNEPQNQKHLIGCLKDLSDVPNTKLREEFLTNTRYLPAKLLDTYRSCIPIAMPYQEQEQEQEQELEQEQESVSPSALDSYPPKVKLPDLPADLDTEEFRFRLTEWLAYKGPRAYKPQGLSAMLSRASNLASHHGVGAVCDAMQRAMANGWKGWDQPGAFDQNGRKGANAADPRGNMALANRLLEGLDNEP